MTKQKKTSDKKVTATNLKLSDDLIAVFRELVQLSFLTGSNVVDHLRAVRVELVGDMVVPTEDYVNGYNAYIEELERQAEKLQAEMQAMQANDNDGSNN